MTAAATSVLAPWKELSSGATCNADSVGPRRANEANRTDCRPLDDDDPVADHPFGAYYHWCALLCGLSEAALEQELLSTLQLDAIRLDLELLFLSAGFEIGRQYGDYRFVRVDRTSPYVVTVARRPRRSGRRPCSHNRHAALRLENRERYGVRRHG
jgi:hypothetical protein